VNHDANLNEQKVYEAKISKLAYQIWEVEGRPHNAADRHWKMACELAESEIEDYIPPVASVNPLDAIEQQEPQ